MLTITDWQEIQNKQMERGMMVSQNDISIIVLTECINEVDGMHVEYQFTDLYTGELIPDKHKAVMPHNGIVTKVLEFEHFSTFSERF